MTDDEIGTSEELTEDTATSAFAALLSDEEDPQETEKPPVQEDPEPAPDAEDGSASTEQAVSEEGKSDPDEATEATDEGQPTETLYPLTINGVTEMVTLQEALKGYSRQKDYTQKTQELAEQRKQLEAELPAVREERVKLADYLTKLEVAIKEATPEEPDWATVQREDPEKFAGLWAQWQVHKNRIKAIEDEKAEAIAAVQRDQAQQYAAYIADQKAKLAVVIPEWKDAAVAKAEKAQMIEYAKSLGYEDADLAEVKDHRMMAVLRDAAKYRALKKKTPAITEQIEKVRVAAPGSAHSGGSAPTSEAAKARARLAKTGKQADAAAAFESML